MSQFRINTNVFFGSNRYNDLKNFLDLYTFNTFFLIVDDAVKDLQVIEEIQTKFKNWVHCIKKPLTIKIKSEPSYNELDNYLTYFKGVKPDIIIAIGGGSLIDLAKGISILLTNPGKGIDYRGMNKVKKLSIPLIAFPTTAGTGTEVTWTASFIDEDEEKKLGINGKNVEPLCGVLEPKLVLSCPDNVAIGAGLDAMVHALEAVTANTNTEITRVLGAKAFSLIYNYLPIGLADRNNLDAWGKVQIGASLAGMAMMNAGGGPASGVSYPLGVYYGVPHGIAGGIFIKGVVSQNIKKGYTGYSLLFDEINKEKYEILNDNEKSSRFFKLFSIFYEKIGAPKTLKKWGVTSIVDINKIVKITMDQRLENLKLNPVIYGEDDLKTLLNGVI